MLVEITSNAGDRNGMFRKIQAGRLEARFRFEHSVARFFCSAGLRNRHHNCSREFIVDLVQHAIESIRIRIVEEVNVQWILRCPKRFGDELRAERRTTDPNRKHMLKFFAARVFRFSAVDVGGKFLELRVCLFDVGAQLRIWCQRGFA